MAEENLDEFLGKVEKPGLLRRWKLWAGLAVLVVLGLLLLQWLAGPGPAGYATTKAETGRLVTSVSATGKLAPTNQVTVGSQLSGLVTKVLVDVNDRVVAGQPLAEIDPETIEDQIRQSKAQLAANEAQVSQARATLAQSQAQYARLEEVSRLSGGKVPSKTELQAGRADMERAQAALDVARANVLASQASLAQNRTQRARAIILSPVSGVVLARQVDPGQTVAASFNTPTLFVIAEDLSEMKLEVAIDEADVGAVEEGQKATFTVDAFPGESFPATITRVEIGSNLTASSASSSSSSSSTTSTTGQVVSYAADLSVANADFKLRPGMTATADIVTSDKSGVLLIPNAALSFSPNGQDKDANSGGIISFGPPGRDESKKSATIGRGARQTIYVLGADGVPAPVEIVTGNTNGQQTAVVSGDLKAGMEVITGKLASGAAN
ncbi:efflux RND transporter periplasmic adaptor subunit [Novosphingobium mangrovi (ex Huang et al. 2023)]|uniref:Efflux RND transporter periplasmic adaptor subunit n=1 Tax=Novosphingobium mangrovi (ex Huang et al. 2023) TaxID=2976432 RepID=A0ABT2I1Q4_9SPHN|nr:efflux RND transporter periplasmic adaptor subunit [Novosphingobium mangrovi (ex Huang et al. 2023)]MCT2398729.1 efflux RND transporter periplasmic adaptor subunit [Novosphingobium mangrovi (ex Huang et al. 2023)]